MSDIGKFGGQMYCLFSVTGSASVVFGTCMVMMDGPEGLMTWRLQDGNAMSIYLANRRTKRLFDMHTRYQTGLTSRTRSIAIQR